MLKMKRRRTTPPKYARHSSGQARVRVNGKVHYLGPYGSPESREKYGKLIAEWMRQNEVTYEDYPDLMIRQLTVQYWDYAKGYYVKNGEPSGHLHIVRNALKYLNEDYRDMPAVEFGPKKLARVRDKLIARGYARKYINDLISVWKRMYRWSIDEELVPGVPKIQALLTRGVGWLKKGRSQAKEPPKVRPVPDACVDAVRDYVPPKVWAMIELQRWTGMRPGEVLIMRSCDLNTSGEVWEYRPESHKNEHHGTERLICIGKNGQSILKQWLRPELDAYVFSGNSDGNRPYRRDAYRNAIVRGCERAFGMPLELRYVARTVAKLKDVSEEVRDRERKRLNQLAAEWRRKHAWSPNRLRHNFATRARKEFGIEAARVTLGHTSAAVSEIYAEIDHDKARAVVARIG